MLNTPREERYDRIVRLAPQMFDVPMVAVNLIDADRRWTKAEAGLDRLDSTDPTTTRGAERLGSLCLLDTRPQTFSADEQTLPQELAGCVEWELALQNEFDRGAQVHEVLTPRAWTGTSCPAGGRPHRRSAVTSRLTPLEGSAAAAYS